MAAPWVVLAMTAVVLAQLGQLETTPDGSLAWNGARILLTVALGVVNAAVWILFRNLRRAQNGLR